MAGLPAPSVIRWKLVTLPHDVLKRAVGIPGLADRAAAAKTLAGILPAASAT